MNLEDKTNTFLALVQKHKGILYKVANSYCRYQEDRQDLIQEIIIQLWKSFDNYDEQYKHSTWIYKIALNVAISFYRKETRRKKISSSLHEGILNFEETNLSEEVAANITQLQQFISSLKELDKALMLLYLEEKSYKEIAEIAGITETNVATKIARIKKNLKHKFSLIKN